MGGKFTGSLLHNIEGVDWDALADSGKIVLRVRVQTWACWTGWAVQFFKIYYMKLVMGSI